MHFSVSPKSSPSSPALSIGFPSSMDSISSNSSSTHSTPSASRGSACAYPSWPSADLLHRSSGFGSVPSSFISDAELFGFDDLDCEDIHAPYLEQPPPPPRQYAMPTQVAMPLLPIYASSHKGEKKRRKSSRKQSSSRAKPMTPISESPETPE